MKKKHKHFARFGHCLNVRSNSEYLSPFKNSATLCKFFFFTLSLFFFPDNSATPGLIDVTTRSSTHSSFLKHFFCHSFYLNCTLSHLYFLVYVNILSFHYFFSSFDHYKDVNIWFSNQLLLNYPFHQFFRFFKI